MSTSILTYQTVLRWTDDQCREYLEHQCWPNGAVCPKCGIANPYTLERKTKTKNKVQKLYKCRACRKQFTAIIGTIFEDSKIPLNKWFAAIFTMCASKKGVSAHQLHRMLGVTYKSAWYMAHRIREAMREKGNLGLLAGTVEADETYIGGKSRGHYVWKERIKDEIQMGIRPKPKFPHHPRMDKAAVFGILERNGKARTMAVAEVNAKTLGTILRENLDLAQTRLITDGNKSYKHIKHHVKHDVIDHEETYVSGDIHIQELKITGAC